MDARVARLLARQEGVVARWQLLAAGWSADAIRHFAGGTRSLGHGVYLTGHARVTQEQRWWAAAVSAPATALAGESAAAAWAMWRGNSRFEVVVRHGSGGPRRIGRVLITRSNTLAGDVTRLRGMPITTPERTIADLARERSAKATAKLVREAVRLRRTSMARLHDYLAGCPGRRGTARLRVYVRRFAHLPFERCRSDAEACGLEVLDAARLTIPGVNEEIAGEEADFSWPGCQLIIEIDGPDFHSFAEEDARKTRTWRAAGWTVRRLPSDRVFDAPAELVELARSEGVRRASV